MSSQYWGIDSERAFIDRLGEHTDQYRTCERSYEEWLFLYIQAHIGSPHSHHRAGVAYAVGKLQRLTGGTV